MINVLGAMDVDAVPEAALVPEEGLHRGCKGETGSADTRNTLIVSPGKRPPPASGEGIALCLSSDEEADDAAPSHRDLQPAPPLHRGDSGGTRLADGDGGALSVAEQRALLDRKILVLREKIEAKKRHSAGTGQRGAPWDPVAPGAEGVGEGAGGHSPWGESSKRSARAPRQADVVRRVVWSQGGPVCPEADPSHAVPGAGEAALEFLTETFPSDCNFPADGDWARWYSEKVPSTIDPQPSTPDLQP